MSQINKPVAPLVPGGVDPEVLDAKADLVNGEVPSEQLPSYVDDVLEFDSVDDFPEEGETGKIYVDLGTNYTYRWSGSVYIQVGGGSSVEANDYSPVFADLERLKIGDTNFIVENHRNAPRLAVYVDTTTPETHVEEKDLENILEDSFGGEIPQESFLCYINLYMDGQPDAYSFYAYVLVEDGGDNPSNVALYSELGAELIYLEQDIETGAFRADRILMPQSLVSNLAEYLEEETGEPAEVENIQSLWLPEERKFVKFADLITPEELDEIGRTSFGKDSQNKWTAQHYYIIRSIKTYSGHVDDESLIGTYTPEEYENELSYPVPTFLTNNQAVLFPVENGHYQNSCWAHLIDSNTDVFLPNPGNIDQEDPPRCVFIQPVVGSNEPSQLIDIIVEFDARE